MCRRTRCAPAHMQAALVCAFAPFVCACWHERAGDMHEAASADDGDIGAAVADAAAGGDGDSGGASALAGEATAGQMLAITAAAEDDADPALDHDPAAQANALLAQARERAQAAKREKEEEREKASGWQCVRVAASPDRALTAGWRAQRVASPNTERRRISASLLRCRSWVSLCVSPTSSARVLVYSRVKRRGEAHAQAQGGRGQGSSARRRSPPAHGFPLARAAG
jgi:hypothetical protein